MIFEYLYKNLENQGSHDFLINKLFGMDPKEYEFFLPQICYIVIKNRSRKLEKLILHICSRDYIFFLKVIY